jgi:hypothetical protein
MFLSSVPCLIQTEPFALTQTEGETIKLEELNFCTYPLA